MWRRVRACRGFFGVRPEIVLKGGLIAHAQMGDSNASIPTPQPVWGRPMFAALGAATAATSVTFVSEAAAARGVGERLGLGKELVAVAGTRSLGKQDMVHNDYLPEISVDPESYEVRIEGRPISSQPARELSLAQRYFLF